MVKVFYHNDPDGWCSAYWVRKHLESEKIPFEASDFIEMNYDKSFPWDKINHMGEQVFMVDFSLNDPEDMIKLSKMCDFTWIDHHKTAIDKMGEFCNKSGWEEPKGIRIDGVAACALTWVYLHGISSGKFTLKDITTAHPIRGDVVTSEYITVDTNEIVIRKYTWEFAPLFTQYIHLWDTWQWKNHPDAMEINEFITALNASNTHPLSINWDALNESQEVICTLVQSGSDMIRFRDGYAKGLCDSIGKVIEFEGHRCFVCNMGHCNSEWFKSVDPSTYDIMMPFYYNVQTEQFCISLYSDKVDVSKIAVKYGGGGHCGASGFQCRNLPF
ncbi:MAG: hypothetical protein WC877_00750 [Dehalococcoidales bacterium]|jgi:hypothetical protein